MVGEAACSWAAVDDDDGDAVGGAMLLPGQRVRGVDVEGAVPAGLGLREQNALRGSHGGWCCR